MARRGRSDTACFQKFMFIWSASLNFFSRGHERDEPEPLALAGPKIPRSPVGAPDSRLKIPESSIVSLNRSEIARLVPRGGP